MGGVAWCRRSLHTTGMRRLAALALALLVLAPACEDKTVDDNGFDSMPMMDVPAPEPTACRDFMTCVQDCAGTAYRLEANCEEAEADPEDAIEPGPECPTIAADIDSCLESCAADVPEADADDRALADEAERCAARVETADDQAACNVLDDECDGQ